MENDNAYPVNTKPAEAPPQQSDMANIRADISEIKTLMQKELGRQKHLRIAKFFFYIIVIAFIGLSSYYSYVLVSEKVSEILNMRNSLGSSIDGKTDELKKWTQENVDELKNKIDLNDIF